jgi:hypothetical protein
LDLPLFFSALSETLKYNFSAAAGFLTSAVGFFSAVFCLAFSFRSFDGLAVSYFLSYYSDYFYSFYYV